MTKARFVSIHLCKGFSPVVSVAKVEIFFMNIVWWPPCGQKGKLKTFYSKVRYKSNDAHFIVSFESILVNSSEMLAT